VPANTVVEHCHADFGHCFVTSIANEIGDIDAGKHSGWARTGRTFKVFPLGRAGTSNVCRFFSEAFAPRSSHFCAPQGFECDLRKNDPK
jgi:hypothetical protein